MRFFCTLPVHGQRNNTDIGLYFYGARWYDSSLGRFTQADTVLPGGQGVQAWDRYAYANNNPARYNDPSGHCLEDLCIGEAILLALVVEEVAPEIEAEVPIVEQEVTTFFQEAEPAVQEAITEGEQTATKVIDNIGKQCSFTADTKVATKDGEKNIGDIKIGDKVLAWNESDNTTDYHNVTAVLVHEDKTLTEVIINGEWIETTPKHPFYTEEKGWLPAGDLEMGMHVRQADGNYELVWLKWNVHKTQEMYNLTVDTAHTFFVGEGQWLVHNTCLPDVVRYSIKNSPSAPISGARSTAINRAWSQEQDLIEATGQGSQNWTDGEMQGILDDGSLDNYTGHHINNVSSYPNWKGDPRNIIFLKNGSDGTDNIHLLEGHLGSWRIPSAGLLIDRVMTMFNRIR